MNISNELAMIISLRNTAVNHKTYCEIEDCNVSLMQLKVTAKYIREYIEYKSERAEADKLIDEMPIS